MGVGHKLRNVGSAASLFDRGAIVATATGEHDFLPEVRHDRVEAGMTTLFGETMSQKKSSKADAQHTKA
jgi:hypothetical protein